MPESDCGRSTGSDSFSDVVDPMVAEAKAIGVPLRTIIDRFEKLEGEEGR